MSQNTEGPVSNEDIGPLTAYANFVIRQRWWLIVFTVVAALVVISGARFIGFDNDYRVFFSDQNPHLQAFDQQQKTYTKNDNILFVITPMHGDVFAPDVLSAVEEATRQAWLLPYALRVDSVTNFQYSQATEDDLVVADLVSNPASLSASELSKIKRVALSEPFIVNQLLSENADVTAVNITFQMPQASLDEVPAAVEAVRALKTEIESAYPVTVHLSGVVMLSNAFFESSMQDMASLIPLMYLVIIITMMLLLRSFGATFATVLVILFSMLTAMGAAGWAGLKLTPPSSAATTIIMTLAVADSIHFLVTMFSGIRKGMSRHDAIRYSMRLNFGPIFLTSLTTAVGFLSMNFSDTPPFHDLGNITAFGVVMAFIFSISFLPALMAVLPVKAQMSESRVGKWMDACGDFVIRRRRVVFAVSALIAIGLVAAVPLNQFDDDFVGYFDESVQFRTDTDYVNENLTGIYQIQYSLPAGEDYGVSNPAFLRDTQNFVEWFRSQPEVVHVNSFTDTFKRINKNMHGDNDAFYRLPEDKELAAQYLLLYELSLPEGLDLNNQMDIGKSATQVIVTLKDMPSSKLAAVSARGEAWLKQNTAMESYGVGPAVMFAHISETNMRSMLLGTFIAILVISLLITLALRNVRLGVLSLIPNLLPLGAAFGAWGLLVGEVNVAVTMVTGMALGIVVDDSVHFLSKYLRARREQGLDREGAVRYAFSSVGVAIIVTSIILVAGFLILAQSSFGMNADMGLLTAITIVVALFADFLLLPILLIKLDAKEYKLPESKQVTLPNTSTDTANAKQENSYA
ncbi:MMPL family transporter [Saccharophagus degradans]|uniref:efflux RND transporter permease subunit n=1 Tax=Saccharophagus degradans TaxID=86304 RepID=UPI002477FC3A|nr:MMPL family transporter [Saccharophagus degradans]WGO97223.1 MMPL family transporter [Saccharophagus degradans]